MCPHDLLVKLTLRHFDTYLGFGILLDPMPLDVVVLLGSLLALRAGLQELSPVASGLFGCERNRTGCIAILQV